MWVGPFLLYSAPEITLSCQELLTGLRQGADMGMPLSHPDRVISLAVLLIFSIVPSAHAQKEQVNTIASQMAGAIANSKLKIAAKLKTVIVFDFTSDDPTLLPLGAVFADDLSTAIATSDPKLRVEDRARLKQMMSDNGLGSSNILNPGIAIWLAHDLGAQVLLLGTLERNAQNVNVSITSYRATDGKAISGFKITIPLSDEVKGLIPESTTDESLKNPASGAGMCLTIMSADPAATSSAFPCAGKDGYSSPKCIRCLNASFSDAAVEHGITGTVVLIAVVDQNGAVTDISVKKALPWGLTKQAIQTVETRKLQPATGPDGKPAAVRIEIG